MALPVVQNVKELLKATSVQDQLLNAMKNKESANLFAASLVDAVSSDGNLQKCQPKDILLEALKAATLRLPINKGLGFAYLVPYKGKPQMQIGYKGYVQLAMRTGKYKYINADVVYKGELQKFDKLTGELDITGEAESDEVIGYFGYIETTNGFKKAIYWTHEKLFAHAKRYSKSFSYESSPWQSNFEEMALKTMLRRLLSKYGVMSIEMLNALDADKSVDEIDFEQSVEQEVADNTGTGDVIDAEYETSDVEVEPQEVEPPKEKKKEPVKAAEKPKDKKETVKETVAEEPPILKEETKEADPFA